MSNSTLYKDEGIAFNEYWASTYVTEVAQLHNDDNEMDSNDNLSENLYNQNESDDVQPILGWPQPHTEQQKMTVTYSDICK